jgi:hypothetical protein
VNYDSVLVLVGLVDCCHKMRASRIRVWLICDGPLLILDGGLCRSLRNHDDDDDDDDDNDEGADEES